MRGVSFFIPIFIFIRGVSKESVCHPCHCSDACHCFFRVLFSAEILTSSKANAELQFVLELDLRKPINNTTEEYEQNTSPVFGQL